ncbi:hypothetical protein M8J76_005925 [Diaphorina citri]|nr:hypothetical protein M8J75_016035 [Diaphorina citri]KAI5744857.1 hypothetical protein M8J76_005925 [Diaphorina citri]
MKRQIKRHSQPDQKTLWTTIDNVDAPLPKHTRGIQIVSSRYYLPTWPQPDEKIDQKTFSARSKDIVDDDRQCRRTFTKTYKRNTNRIITISSYLASVVLQILTFSTSENSR